MNSTECGRPDQRPAPGHRPGRQSYERLKQVTRTQGFRILQSPFKLGQVPHAPAALTRQPQRHADGILTPPVLINRAPAPRSLYLQEVAMENTAQSSPDATDWQILLFCQYLDSMMRQPDGELKLRIVQLVMKDPLLTKAVSGMIAEGLGPADILARLEDPDILMP